MPERPKLAVYWAASCGGCEIAFVNLHGRLLELAGKVDLFFCPCLVDTKRAAVEDLPDGAIALTLFDGAIRTSENEEMARLLRRKSKILVAYGACAYGGGVPALANLSSRKALLETVFFEGGATENPDRIVPLEETPAPVEPLRLPRLLERVRPLSAVVPVDYSIPGCPPESARLQEALDLLLSPELPPPGSILGAGVSTLCDECRRKREEKKISGFRRIWEFVPDPERCLLEQGIPCVGVVTRDGCGALCPEANMPCIGCYGPPPGVFDVGTKLLSTLGSILDLAPLNGSRDPREIERRFDEMIAPLPDLAGLGGRFHLAGRDAGGEKP
jgi:F420-non-reducing hydrogenase small subunit